MEKGGRENISLVPRGDKLGLGQEEINTVIYSKSAKA
jgi:hypothetical protein